MTTRREFLQISAGALAGIAFVGCDLGVSDADKVAMLGGTAMKLLGIKA